MSKHRIDGEGENNVKKGGGEGNKSKEKETFAQRKLRQLSELFEEHNKRTGKYFWRALFMRGPYERDTLPEEYKRLEEIKERVRNSDLPEEDKKMLLDLLLTIKKGDNFDCSQAAQIVNFYMDKIITSDQFKQWREQVYAWRNGTIKEFAKKIRGDIAADKNIDREYQGLLLQLFDIALQKDELAAALALRYFFQDGFYPEFTLQDKIERMKELIKIFEAMY